jgi:hypothetical protein
MEVVECWLVYFGARGKSGVYDAAIVQNTKKDKLREHSILRINERE